MNQVISEILKSNLTKNSIEAVAESCKIIFNDRDSRGLR